MRTLEPKVRKAVSEARLIALGVRAGVRAGTAAYKRSRAPKR